MLLAARAPRGLRAALLSPRSRDRWIAAAAQEHEDEAARLADEITVGQGFVVLENAFAFDTINAARNLVIQRLQEGVDTDEDSNEEESALIYHLLDHHPLFSTFTEQKVLTKVLSQVLGTDFVLSSFAAHCLFPGFPGQPVHLDYPYDLFEHGMTEIEFEQALVTNVKKTSTASLMENQVACWQCC